MKRAALALAALVAIPLLAACDTSPGVVTGNYTSQLGGITHYFVVVKHSKSGKNLDEDVPIGVFISCTKGDKWPECAK